MASRVQELLERHGWKQRELARRCSLSPSSIDWIIGHPEGTPKVTTIEAIAKAANVSVAWLQRGEGTIDDPWVPAADDDASRLDEPSVQRANRVTRPERAAGAARPGAARQDLIDSLSKAVGELSRAGDIAGARIASETLARLFAEGAHARADGSSADEQGAESGVTKKFA